MLYLYQSDVWEVTQKTEELIIISTNKGTDVKIEAKINEETGKAYFDIIEYEWE